MKLLLFIVGLVASLHSMAQIQITPYIEDYNCSRMPSGICEVIEQKLTDIISSNGLQSQMGESRFVMTCNVTEESKEVMATAPVKVAYVLNLNMVIGDGETGTKYISKTFRVKSIGNSEEKAYRNAIKNMNLKSQEMVQFVGDGKKRILDYYENNKGKILSSINACIKGKDLERASYELCLIPQECSYYNEVQETLGVVSKQIVDKNSSQLLISAKAIWAKEQNEETANQVANMIAEVSPNASCYKEAKQFIEAVNDRMEELNNREWVAKQKQLAHQREMEITRENNRSAEAQRRINAQKETRLAAINAVRAVAVEYARNRPKVIYNVHTWY